VSLDKYMFLLLLFATCLMLFISYLSFKKRQLAVAKYTALVMLSASFYSLGYAFEMISTDLDSIKFWLKIEYIGAPVISTFWLILVLHYTGHKAILKKRVLLLLFVIPFVTFIMHYTNDMHHFFYKDVQLDQSSILSTVQLFKGPWYWVHISYNYLQALVGMFLFVTMFMKAVPLVRKQIMILMLGAAAPWVSNVMYLIGGFEVVLDLTPLGFTLTGLFYIWGIYRFNLLRLVPIALQKVFETMQDVMVILDYDHNITSVNQAAKDIFGETRINSDYSISVYNVFYEYPELLSKIVSSEKSESQITIRSQGENRYYKLNISVISDSGQTVIGKMLVFSDITQVTVYQEKLLSNANQLAKLSAFKDKLFTVVAHDIRDPLAVLINLTELLEEELEVLGSEHSNVFQEVSEQVRNTYMLAENLLDWFRSQQGKIIFSPLVWDVSSIVQHAVQSIKIRLDVKKIQITTNVEDEIRVFADKEMLDLVLRNLLSNAIKFTGLGGHIHVEAVKEGE
jgi:PAS domain S-box-containing protein